MIRLFKAYYWNVRYDMPRDTTRTKLEMLQWVFLYPWYGFLRTLAKAGFLNPEEGSYMRLRDFTPFFWRTLINRKVAECERYWKRQLAEEHNNSMQLLETARRNAQEEVWEYLENRIDQDFGKR